MINMLTKEDLELLSQMLDTKLDKKLDEKIKPINEQLNKMQEDIEILKEDTKEVRVTVEEFCKWIDLNFDYKYPFPIDKNIGVG